MGKGILLEVEGRFGVVLTPQGEFKRVPLPSALCQVGDEIAYQERRVPQLGWLVAAAAACLLLISPLGYWQWTLAQPAALVMIDINPSVELTVNGRELVIAAEGLNEDGQEVLEGLAWQKRPLDEVARAITARAVEAGKLDPAGDGSTVVVAVVPVGERPMAVAPQAIVEVSRLAVQQEVAAQAEARGVEPRTGVAAVQATNDEAKKAKEQGLTLPKLIILEELQAEHPEVTPEVIRSKPPGQLMKDLGINAKELLNKAEEQRNQKKETVQPASSPGRPNQPPGQQKKDRDDDDDRRNGPGQAPGQQKKDRGDEDDRPGRPGQTPVQQRKGEQQKDDDDRRDRQGGERQSKGEVKLYSLWRNVFLF